MFVVVTYDVSSDPRRNRVARVMEDHGRRVQYSVFDCDLNEKTLTHLRQELSGLIDHETDSVRFYRLCRACRHTVDVIGAGTVRENPDIVVV